MPDDRVASTLAEIRERAKAAADFPLAEIAEWNGPDRNSISGWIAMSALDVPVLLAAVEKVLEKANEWDRIAAGSLHEIDEMLPECAKALRETVLAALAGEDGES